MTLTTDTSHRDLALRWLLRVQTGNFSPAVLGVGTIRVMGKSGDAPVAFPRIASLALLDQLEPDEQWALHAAEAIVAQAQAGKRHVLAVQPPGVGEMPQAPLPVITFDPQASTLVVVSMITGG